MYMSVASKRIVSDPKILNGKPIIKGTRISVEFILELFRSGMSHQQIMNEYDQLTKEDIAAALTFAKHAVSREEIIPLKLAIA